MKKIIITISREFGSGGRLIGELLAKELGIAFYDKKLIEIASEKSGYTKEVFENSEKDINNSLLYSIAMGSYSLTGLVHPITPSLIDQAFQIQADIIKEIAQRESCVIVGRCANFVLNKLDECTNVFVHANIEARKRRAINEYKMNEKGIDKEIAKIDKSRQNYYHYYTDLKWGDIRDHHITFDTGNISIETGVSLIKTYLDI